MKRVCQLIVGVALAACHAQPEDSLDTPRAGPSQAEPEVVPADTAALAKALRARHTDDLPGVEELAHYTDAEASLRELARNADTMLVRTRALMLLRHFHSEPTGLLLIQFVQDPALHPALRAAAVTGLAGQPLDQRPEWLTVVGAALRDSDPRVALAAVDVLGASPAGRVQLQQALEEGLLSEQVRAAIEVAE